MGGRIHDQHLFWMKVLPDNDCVCCIGKNSRAPGRVVRAPDEEVIDADPGGEPSLLLTLTKIFASPLRVHFAFLNYRFSVRGLPRRLSSSALSDSRLLRAGGQRSVFRIAGAGAGSINKTNSTLICGLIFSM
jgi:hypothetical protein